MINKNVKQIAEKETEQKLINSQEKKDRLIVYFLFKKLFKNLIIDEQEISDKTDLKITGFTTEKNRAYNIEIKERKMSSTQYSDCFLEVNKFNALMATIGTHSALYIAIYNDLICVWNLDNIDFSTIKKEYRFMNEKTLTFDENKVRKEVYYLPLSLAYKYKKNIQ